MIISNNTNNLYVGASYQETSNWNKEINDIKQKNKKLINDSTHTPVQGNQPDCPEKIVKHAEDLINLEKSQKSASIDDLAEKVERVIIIGGGVAGSEAGTFLGQISKTPLKLIEIESEPSRKFGGWGFQSFPDTETTNLALRKMYLGEDPEDIHRWVADPQERNAWPTKFKDLSFSRDRPLPRSLMQRYVQWRREKVDNDLVTYESVTGEAVKVSVDDNKTINVRLTDGRIINGDRLILASGSISAKVPEYLKHLSNDKKVIIDPLTRNGHERRAKIPQNAKVLILGTGLSGEEQASILRKSNHTNLSLLSRSGKQHFVYPLDQKNIPLSFETFPNFFHAENSEEFDRLFSDFLNKYLENGHSLEDIFDAIRPLWNDMKRDIGGDEETAKKLFEFRRSLAVNSIGVTAQVAETNKRAREAQFLSIKNGYIEHIDSIEGGFKVHYRKTKDEGSPETEKYDYIINAIGRSILQHPLWSNLLEDGLATKHSGIGIKVSEMGQLIDAKGDASDLIFVVGMSRAGDHMLRHGFLGNTAFNVPQVRAHLYSTIRAVQKRIGKTTRYPHLSLEKGG